MDNDTLLIAYEMDEQARGLAPRSIRENSIKLRTLVKRSGKSFLTVSRHDIIEHLAQPTLGPSSKANYRSVFHKFFAWLQEEQYRADNPSVRLPTVRVTKKEADPFTTDELQHLINTGMYRHTRLKVLLYAYQGFRAVEIAAVSGENINWEQQLILSAEGKGGKEVWRPIHPLVWEELKRWPKSGFLFPSIKKNGKHVTAGSVSTALSQAIKRAGLHHRPHHLRAWFATEQIEAGSSTQVVAAAMRHGDLQSLDRYVRVSQTRMRESMELLPSVIIPSSSMRRAA